jgi:hypothetical protein
MGDLIPNPNDLQIVDGLNARFTGLELQNLRAHIQNNNDDFFANGRHLRRITWRLNVFPTSGPKPKGRWLTFLKDILPQPIHDQILAELRDAVGNPAKINNACAGVRFWAVYDPTLATPYGLVVDTEAPDANGSYWKTITLTCFAEIPANVQGDPSNPPADNGENGPPQPALRTKKAGGKRTGKKGSTKKAKKSPVKKAVKKVAKKKKKKSKKR